MSNPIISVIVPVYNVEKYLSICIESILNQSYSNFELLLINDGSTDRSGDICDEYAKIDSRIRVFHKGNGGVSSARNQGINEARGEWVMFIDADDILNTATLEECIQYKDQYDVIRFSMRLLFNPDGSIYKDIVLNDNITQDQYIINLISRKTILGVCGGLYRTKTLNEHGIRFNPKYISGEDWLVQVEILLNTKRLKIINKPLYYYNKFTEDSCTKKFRFEVHYSALLALKSIEKIIDNKFPKDILIPALSRAKCMLVYDFIASKISKGQHIIKEDFIKYRQEANLTYKDICIRNIPLKWKLLLSLYISPFGKYIL